jgi:hypothetical protein
MSIITSGLAGKTNRAINWIGKHVGVKHTGGYRFLGVDFLKKILFINKKEADILLNEVNLGFNPSREKSEILHWISDGEITKATEKFFDYSSVVQIRIFYELEELDFDGFINILTSDDHISKFADTLWDCCEMN